MPAVLQSPSPAPSTPGNKVPWKVELPKVGAKDDQFGGCRSIEVTYEKVKQIGEGTYGQVYLGRDLASKEDVALKKVRMDNEKEGFPITAIREIKLLSMLQHENIINLREIVRSQVHVVNNFKGSIYMVFDYMDHDLTGLMQRRGHKFEVKHIKSYIRQLLRGIEVCHGQGIMHRDLKASNLLINNQGVLKIGDFGLARTYNRHNEENRNASRNIEGRYTNRVITLWYRPPELLLGSEHYGPEIDMWSAGCIMAELLLPRPLFAGSTEAEQIELIAKVFGTPNEDNMPGVSSYSKDAILPPSLKSRYTKNVFRERYGDKLAHAPGAIDLLEKLLCMDPRKRISASNALQDPFFQLLEPLPARPEDMPHGPPSHEMGMKAEKQKRKQQQQQQQQGHGAAAGAKRPRPDINPYASHGQQQRRPDDRGPVPGRGYSQQHGRDAGRDPYRGGPGGRDAGRYQSAAAPPLQRGPPLPVAGYHGGPPAYGPAGGFAPTVRAGPPAALGPPPMHPLPGRFPAAPPPAAGYGYAPQGGYGPAPGRHSQPSSYPQSEHQAPNWEKQRR